VSARDALAAMRGRLADIQVRVADDIADLDRFPTRLLSQSQHDRRVLARHNAALVEGHEAVLAIHQPEWTGPDVLHASGYYRCSADHWTLDDQTPACPTVHAIETALDPR
jgi:hypothetical protein